MTTPEELLNILEDLNDEEFEDFKWRLQRSKILVGCPSIKKSRLQKAKRRDTVDLMVQTYTLSGAVDVTRKVLEKIKRNDLLLGLPASSSEQQAAKPGEGPCDEFFLLKEEYEEKKEALRNTEAEIQKMIKKRQLKIQKIKESVKTVKNYADREKAEGVQVFTALMESAKRGLKKLVKEIEDKQETTEKQAEGFIKDLEQEISELMKRSSEVEHLSRSEDHLHLIQSFSSLKAAPPTKDWTEVSVHPAHEGIVVRAVVQLEERLRKGMKKKLFEAELKRVQQYAVDVTLDPRTANPHLILSDDEKQVHDSGVRKNLPDNPERFSQCPGVLGSQSFSSGRFYFEVQVKGKIDWDLGVATESISRKGEIRLNPQDCFWTVWLRNGNEYRALADLPVRLCLQPGPEKVGVFVDYEEGLVSFYDVDAAALIYSFTGCSFTQKLHPFFSPCIDDGGKNSAPLIIRPVKQTGSTDDSFFFFDELIDFYRRE